MDVGIIRDEYKMLLLCSVDTEADRIYMIGDCAWEEY